MWVGLRPTNRNSADQSRRMLCNSSVMVMYCWCVLPAFARYRSSCPKIGFPHGMEIDANCSLPCNFWKRHSSNRLTRRASLRSASISLHFFWGNSIVCANLSNSQPRTSLRNAHVPSSINYFSDTGGPMVLTVNASWGNTLLMPLRIFLDNCRSSTSSVLCSTPMKSSM
jgi:hypothetical protein